MQKLSTTSNSDAAPDYAEVTFVPVGTVFYICEIEISHIYGIMRITLDKRCLTCNVKRTNVSALKLLPNVYYGASVKTLFPNILPTVAGVITSSEMKTLEQLYSDNDKHTVISKEIDLPEFNSVTRKLMSFDPDAIRDNVHNILHDYREKLYNMVENVTTFSNKLFLADLNS